jgi:zinc/manganese transport system substrate-binding protein
MKTIKWLKLIGTVIPSLCGLFFAGAQVRVVTTYPELESITEQVGGDRVSVSSLARWQDDPHQVTPRPSLALEISRCRLFVRTGMDLDLWADDLLSAARNGKVMKGSAGYVDCSVGIRKQEVPSGQIDSSQGDIHLYGNPHYLLDPLNAKIVAKNIVEGLKRIDPAGANRYDSGYAQFVKQIDDAMSRWQRALAPFRGVAVVTYHKTWVYFLTRFGLQEFGTIEPKPGIPPSPGHLRSLMERMKSGNCKVILIDHFRSRRFPDTVARGTGAEVVVAPIMVGAEGSRDYVGMMDLIVNRLAAAMK